MNPWISIWKEPRNTITRIVDENPNRSLWILAWIYGFLSLLNGSQSLALGNRIPFVLVLLLSIIIAPFWGMVVFAVWSWVVHLFGKLLKGQASFSFVRAAFAWSCVPLTINIVLWIVLFVVFGRTLLETSEPNIGPMVLVMLVLIAKVAVLIWSLVIYINALAEVQRFSVGRAIVNVVLAWIALGVVIALIWMGIGFLFHASFTPSQAVLNLTFGM